MGKGKEDREKNETINNIVLGNIAKESIQRYGSAVKEHIVSYSGIDNETGIQLKKGLKQIGNQRVNPEYERQNLKQQAGFAAENKYTARENAKRIINGQKTRIQNTDIKGSGGYNQVYDHFEFDSNGKVISGSGEQMKFVGSSPKECLNRLASPKFQKYLDANAKITVPSDYYQGLMEEIDTSIVSLQKQIVKAKANGNTGLAKRFEIKIAKYQKIKVSLKDSGITNKEAMYARLHPKLSTAKDIGLISLQAGVTQAFYGAAVGGAISIIKNLVELVKGEKTDKDAVISIGNDTIKAGSLSFAIGFSGSMIKGTMQNSSSIYIRTLSKTNVAATLVSSVDATTKTLEKYIRGKITGLECFEELGETGTTQIASVMFGTIGQMVIPVPVIGSIIGSIIGYVFTSSCYKVVVSALKEEKLAYKERVQMERECAEVIKLIKQYRNDCDLYIQRYLTDYRVTFNKAFKQMYKSMSLNDIDGFIIGANKITQKLGGNVHFRNKKEFEDFMDSPESFKL